MKRIIKYAWIWTVFLLLGTACQEDAMMIDPDVSHGKSTEAGETLESVGALNSVEQPKSNIVNLYIGNTYEAENPDAELEDEIYFELVKPVEKNLTLTVAVDEGFREDDDQYKSDYCELFKKEHNMMVTSILSWQGGVDRYIKVNGATEGTITIPAGQRKSSKMKLTFIRDAELMGGQAFIFPLTAIDTETGEEYGRIDYIIHTFDKGVRGNRDITVVAYVNTEVMNPLIADQLTRKVEKMIWDPYEIVPVVPLSPVVDILNVRTAMLKNEQGRAMLGYTTDMEYVLKHNDKYIQPMRQGGMKVCLTIKGGGTGLGFCNLTDEQVADFAAQVKVAVDIYELDGVNLWDEGSDYGKAGMPPMNDTSYAKLIKTLKETMPGKLVTLTDTPETTSSLRSVQGGISAGQYLDYAWSPISAFLNPYVDGAELKPVAGLEMAKYGSISVPMLSSKMPYEEMEVIENNLFLLVDGTTVINDKVFVFDDLTYIDYGDEGILTGTFAMILGILYDMNPQLESPDYSYAYMTMIETSGSLADYYAFRKDW